ncbi:collagen-like protein [Croceivirga sp. JEA036]|uniref:collagen-like triple helix repeat-containing protein n=1 Tax=Croceivirga sp. JEA036 TaxID=2721162 RepID=UPI00143C1B86|nr:collagen-like protein [Croceivirga sp. JEA036]NJB37876.1 collagen-like protein [Croceivirga sp. JEA036]
MKTTILNFRLLMMMLSAVLVISCSAEDGEDGAIGPQGPQGEQGIQGAPGQDGTDGEDGNANIMASDWIASDFPTESSNYGSFSVNDTAITQNALDTWVILAYGKSGTYIVMLPDGIENDTYGFSLQIETIIFEAYTDDGTASVFDRFQEFRYVMIPASMAGKGSPIDFSKMDYYELMDYLGLEY